MFQAKSLIESSTGFTKLVGDACIERIASTGFTKLVGDACIARLKDTAVLYEEDFQLSRYHKLSSNPHGTMVV